MGDSRQIILDAIQALGLVLTELTSASLYETDPLHVTDQGCFLNTVVCGLYQKSPEELLDQIHLVEARFGRDRTKERRWGERTLDIDILLFGDLVLSSKTLEIPHPRLHERRFALEPLLELRPEICCPKTKIPYRETCDKLPPQGVRKLGILNFR